MPSAITSIAVLLTLKDQFSSALANSSKSVDKFESKLKGLDKTTQTVARGFNGLGEGMEKWGRRGALAVGGAMAFGLKDAAKQAIDVEHELANIANTAGTTTGKFKGTLKEWKTSLASVSQQTNQTQGDLMRGFGALVSKGMDPKVAMAITRSVGHAATATGADVEELGRSIFATYDNLKVPVADVDRALEMMASAGNEGAFELRDMARYFPQLTASASQLGVKGVKGVASLGAALQIALKGAGDPDEAANNFKNFLAKLSAPETAKNFKKFGVNYSTEMKKAIASGDPVMYFTKLTQKVTKGDRMKLGQLFSDMQVQNFLAPMLANMDEYQRIRNQASNSKGLLQQEELNMMGTAAEQMKRLQINTEATVQTSNLLGVSLDGLTGKLAALNDSGMSKVAVGASAFGAAAGTWALGKAIKWGTGRVVRGLTPKPVGAIGARVETALGGAGLAGGGMPVTVTNWPGSFGGAGGADGGLGGAATEAAAGSLWQKAMALGKTNIKWIPALGAGAVGTAAAGVTGAGAAGWAAGSALYNHAIAGTSLGDVLGEAGAKVMAAFGNQNAQNALQVLAPGSQNNKVDGTIEIRLAMPPGMSSSQVTVSQPADQNLQIKGPRVGKYMGGVG